MPKFPIKLGKKFSEPLPVGPASDSTHYPSLYLEWDSKYELPESGTLVVRFRKTSETTEKRNEKESQRVSLDITEITSVKSDKTAPKEEEPGDVLDKLREEAENEESEYPEN